MGMGMGDPAAAVNWQNRAEVTEDLFESLFDDALGTRFSGQAVRIPQKPPPQAHMKTDMCSSSIEMAASLEMASVQSGNASGASSTGPQHSSSSPDDTTAVVEASRSDCSSPGGSAGSGLSTTDILQLGEDVLMQLG